MNVLRRWELMSGGGDRNSVGWMERTRDGKFVEYTQVAELVAENAALKQAQERLRDNVTMTLGIVRKCGNDTRTCRICDRAIARLLADVEIFASSLVAASPPSIECPACGGNGWENGNGYSAVGSCLKCHGEGKI